MCSNVHSYKNTPAGNIQSLADTQMCACACGHRHTHTLTGGQADTQTCIIKWTKTKAFRHIFTHTHSPNDSLHLFQHSILSPLMVSLTHTEEKPPSFCINIPSLVLCPPLTLSLPSHYSLSLVPRL